MDSRKRDKSKKKRGRPLKEYKLVKNFKEIVMEVIQEKRKELEKIKQDLKELEELVNEIKG